MSLPHFHELACLLFSADNDKHANPSTQNNKLGKLWPGKDSKLLIQKLNVTVKPISI